MVSRSRTYSNFSNYFNIIQYSHWRLANPEKNRENCPQISIKNHKKDAFMDYVPKI